MTKKKKDALIGFLIFLGIIIFFTLLTMDQPFEIHKQPRKPSYSEQYRKKLKEFIKEQERRLQEGETFLEREKR